MARPEQIEIPEWQDFGEALRFFRETYQARFELKNPGLPQMPRIRVTALSLIEDMNGKKEYGYEIATPKNQVEEKDGKIYYSISSGAYSEIEAGISIPKNPSAFLRAVARCLSIEEDSDEYKLLRRQLSYDVVRKKLGKEAADRDVLPARYLRDASTKPPVQ